ncbi:hypothetical protein EDB84DRAFT_224413 [Lactarius hengduanensis]|nr:hypothetical protein EDB84DRAFT_224413 [Lactarius hengduanensis]
MSRDILKMFRKKGLEGELLPYPMVDRICRNLNLPSPRKLVSDDDCRRAIRLLNNLRFLRVETLEDGYNCLEELVFTPVIKNLLAKYMNGMVTARTLHDDLAMVTRAEVEKALAETDTSNLKASFRQALSFSIPPITLYRNYRPSTFSDSDLIFGVPLVDLTTNRDNVPQVMRMCIEEVEKRGLNISKIYSVDHPFRAEVLQFRRRFESEKPFSFSSADNIHSVAMLLMLYLLDLPEPLFILSLQDYRNYGQNRARYAKNGFSLLRSKSVNYLQFRGHLWKLFCGISPVFPLTRIRME